MNSISDFGDPNQTRKIGIWRNINSKNTPRQSLIKIKQMMVINECVISIAPPTLKVRGINKNIPPIPRKRDSNCMISLGISTLLYTIADSGFITPPKA